MYFHVFLADYCEGNGEWTGYYEQWTEFKRFNNKRILKSKCLSTFKSNKDYFKCNSLSQNKDIKMVVRVLEKK